MANVQAARFFERRTNDKNGYGRISFSFPRPNYFFDSLISLAAFSGMAVTLFFFKTDKQILLNAALLATVFILYNLYKIFKPVSATPTEIQDDNLLSEVKWVGNGINGVVSIENCTVTKSGNKYHIALVIVVKPDITISEGSKIATEFEKKLRTEVPHVESVSINIEPFL